MVLVVHIFSSYGFGLQIYKSDSTFLGECNGGLSTSSTPINILFDSSTKKNEIIFHDVAWRNKFNQATRKSQCIAGAWDEFNDC